MILIFSNLFQDLTGQNSNDSSSGGGAAPGTPNSQGMRPTPSPTGSSGSRSMSPAVGQYQVFFLINTMLWPNYFPSTQNHLLLSFTVFACRPRFLVVGGHNLAGEETLERKLLLFISIETCNYIYSTICKHHY